MKTRNKSEIGYLEEVEQEMMSQHEKLEEQLGNYDKMRAQYDYMREYRMVLIKNEGVVDSYLQDVREAGGESACRSLKLVFGVVGRD